MNEKSITVNVSKYINNVRDEEVLMEVFLAESTIREDQEENDEEGATMNDNDDILHSHLQRIVDQRRGEPEDVFINHQIIGTNAIGKRVR